MNSAKNPPRLLFGMFVMLQAFALWPAWAEEGPTTRKNDEDSTAATSQPAGKDSAEDTAEPAAQIPADEDAMELATKVFEAHGGKAFDEVAELRFRFVVERDGKRAFEAMHRWDLRNSRDRVTWTDRDGRKLDAVVDLRDRSAPKGTIDGKSASAGGLEELAQNGYARWVNDSYWLIMPLKLSDPGVSLKRGQPRKHDGKTYEILELSFQQVGLTPGDRYSIFIDPQTHLVTRWEMRLEGREDQPRQVSWENHHKVGPLTLALDHVSDGSNVRFEDVEALKEVRAEDFELD